MTAASHPRTGPAGLAGLAGVLVVVGVAGLALLLGSGSSPAIVAPAPSPVPGAPHGVSQADGSVVYGRYVRRPGAGDLIRGLAMLTTSGTSSRQLSGNTVCCASLGGRNILFTRRTASGTRDTLLTTRPGHIVTRPLRLPFLMLGPGVLSPDGSRIAVWATDRNRPHHGVLEVHAGGRWYQIGSFSSRPARPLSFSPDGSQVLVFRPSTDPPAGEIGVISIRSGRYRRITPAGMASWCCHFGSPAGWSPGGRIAFAAFQHPSTRNGLSAVFVTEQGTQDVRRVTDWGLWTASAQWSPDGRKIAFDTVNGSAGAHDLFVIDPDGGSPALIPTPADGSSCCAVWTPNGKALVYETGVSEGHMDLSTVNVDGTGSFPLTTVHSGDLAAFAVTPWR